jgi:hypothetical protein
MPGFLKGTWNIKNGTERQRNHTKNGTIVENLIDLL